VLVPNNNLVFGGAGTNRTLTITPAPGLTGTTTITITVGDGTNSVSTSFQLTVSQPTATNTPPNVSAGIDQTITLPLAAVLPGVVTDDGMAARDPNPWVAPVGNIGAAGL
jgi:hypothetical protein